MLPSDRVPSLDHVRTAHQLRRPCLTLRRHGLPDTHFSWPRSILASYTRPKLCLTAL